MHPISVLVVVFFRTSSFGIPLYHKLSTGRNVHTYQRKGPPRLTLDISYFGEYLCEFFQFGCFKLLPLHVSQCLSLYIMQAFK